MKLVAASFEVPVLKSGVQRKVITTETFKAEGGIVIRKIQKHMCHSTATCEKFYQQADNNAAIISKGTIEKLIETK